jgi:hypothetical protein
MIGLGLNIAKSKVPSPAGVDAIMAVSPTVWYNELSLSDFSVNQYAAAYIDQSGNHFDLYQPDGAKQAQVVDSGDGKKALLFTNDFLFESDVPVLQGDTNFTMIYAGFGLNNYHTALYVGDDDTPSAASSFRIGRSTYNALRGIVGTNINGSWNSPYSFSVNDANIAYAYKKGTDSSDIYLGVDDGRVSRESQFGVSGIKLEFGGGFGIGTNNPDDPSATGTGVGWVLYEVLIYDRALTNLELAQTRQYLREKWNM